MEFNRMKAALEALLYVTDSPLTIARMKEALGGDEVDAADVRAAILSVVEDFEGDGRGVRVAEIAGGYQIITRPEYAWYIKRLQKIKPPKLSSQALETLAIVAYRQPIIKAEIEVVRGVSADGVLRTLLDRRLIKIVGRQDVPGKPMMYGTTHEFLQYFGLKDLASLPSLRELERELGMEGNTLLSDLEPELPGFDGPEMEQMAADYRVKKAAVEAEQKAKEEAEVQEALARELAGAEEVIEGAGDEVPEVVISGGEDAVADAEDLAAGEATGPRFVMDDPDEGAETGGLGGPEPEKG